jgi:hypothetical protein
VIDTVLSDGTTARRALTARPWARFKWWAAASADALSDWPGAWTPVPYPRNAEQNGSFSVVSEKTRSPSARPTTSANAANLSAVSRFSQPPASWSGWGRSQW